ncbi:alpha/beta hydrolase [Patescibacteria group bacterium]|nr:alpha/beta hydrolase [Patescibacteria group bacterium]
MTTFLLLHGYGGTHPEHWQSYLANRLKDEGQTVLFPDLPNADRPQLNEWLGYLEDVLQRSPDLVVAAHSLGCTLWLHYVARHPEVKPKKVFLVAPPLNDCDIEELASFFPLPELDLSVQNYQMIGSDNDNFILEEEFKTLADNLKIPLRILPGAGHINAPLHGDWEWMNEQMKAFSL